MQEIIIAPRALLSHENPKTAKGVKYGYLTSIMHFLPAEESGKNVCSHASPACKATCLNESGHGGWAKHVRIARLRRTRFFFYMRKLFFEQLHHEIRRAIFRAESHGLKPCFRLNGTSDIAWEAFRPFDGKNIFEAFPLVQFYDYTKNPTRFEKELPENYYLLFSRDETNEAKAMELLARGVNVAVVFDKALPKTYMGSRVINGEISDLRFLDGTDKNGRGLVVGLIYKRLTARGATERNAYALKSGFVVPTKVVRGKVVACDVQPKLCAATV